MTSGEEGEFARCTICDELVHVQRAQPDKTGSPVHPECEREVTL